MSDDITHDLDLLDDWLAGKGYGEEAGLVLRALSLIHKLQDGVRSTIQERDVLSGENFDLRAENEKLRAAKAELLRLFDEAMDGYADCIPYKGYYLIEKHGDKENFDDLRSAAAALKETGDE